MTLEHLYKVEPIVTPPFSGNISDDSSFCYIFAVPENKKTLSINISNAIDAYDVTIAENVQNPTINLVGSLYLSSTSIEIQNGNNAKLNIAGHNTRSIIFDYVINPLTSKKQLKISDKILNTPITKILNLYDKSSYLEYDGNLNFTEGQIVTVSGIDVIIRVGHGIIDKAGVVGFFATDYKNISYYANFSPKQSNLANKTDYQNYKIDLVNPFVNNQNDIVNNKLISKTNVASKNNRLDAINQSIISPAIANISSINDVKNGTFINNTISIDGTSDTSIPQIVNSWNKLPFSTNTISFGISNITPKDNNNSYVQTTMVDVSIKFNWYYSPVVINNYNDSEGNILIDNWLIHTYQLITTQSTNTEGEITTTVSDIPPIITYTKDDAGYINELSFVNNKRKYVLFAGNDIIYRYATHELDYTREPYGSSNATQFSSIRNSIYIPCLYEFAVDRIRVFNDASGNPQTVGKYATKMTVPFLIGDTVLHVADSSQFMENGYLQISYYTVDISNVGTQERRIYTFVDNEIMSYQKRDNNTFYGIARGLFNTTIYNYPKINSNEIKDWYYEVTSYYNYYV